MYVLKYILLLSWLTVTFPLFSQEDNSATEPTKQEVVANAELIPALEITNKLPDATNRINSIRLSLITTEILNKKKDKLDTFISDFNKFKNNYSLKKANNKEQSRLQNELYNWVKEKEKINSIQHSFDDIKNDLLAQKKSLLEIKTLWEKSLKAAKGDNLPRNAKRMVNSFLKDIENINLIINKKNEFVYSQLEVIANITILINDNIQEINNKIGNLTETLLLKRESSIFSSLTKNINDDENSSNENYTLKDIYTPISVYVSDNLIYLVFLAFFFLLLLVLLNYIKKSIKPDKYTRSDAKLIAVTFEILSRPFITSVLILLLSSNILLYDAPPIFKTFIYFLLLIPVMIILPVITAKRMNVYIYGLGLLYLLTLFLRIEIVSPLTKYLIVLGAIIITLWGIENFLRKRIIHRILSKSISRVIVTTLFYIFTTLLIVAFLSIVIGYNTFGLFLFDNTIWSVYRFFLFYAAYVFIEGFTELFLFSAYASQVNSIKKYVKDILSWSNSFVLYLIIFLLLKEIASLFKIDNIIFDSIISVWRYKIPIGEINFTLGNIITLVLTIWLSFFISKIVSTVLEQDVLKKLKLKRGVPRTISILVRYSILTVGFLVAVAAAGMELSNFTIIIGALGVGIGFGLQDIINNFISGLILLFERPIQIGDTVQVGELWGTVKNIGIRSSIIRSFDGSEVIVPNGMLISREVTNWTLSDQKRRLEIEVGVEYGTNLKQVIDILTDCAGKHEVVMDDPAPLAWFTGFGDSSINFKLVFWHPSFDGGLSVKSEVAISVFDALEKAGITIPFPQQDVYIKENKLPDTKQPAVKKIKNKPTTNRVTKSANSKEETKSKK